MTGGGDPVTVGTELPALAAAPIDRSTLALYATASGDHNPVHLDPGVARSAGLDDVFAHGMLSMAYLGRLLTGWARPDQLRSFQVRFTAVTGVHRQPTCRGTVVAIDEVAGQRLARVELTVTVDDGTETLTGEAVIALD